MEDTKPNNLASLLRDFAQGASNSVAGNVAVPVDAIAWLLRKGGVNVPPNPVMGSDWMAEKGLTREPQNKLAGLVGDMAGMVAPFAAAAKAPQIARGLLAAGEAMPEFAASAGRPANYLPKKIDQTGAINLGNERLLKILERNGESVAPKTKFEYPIGDRDILAQQRAALPISENGLGLPANNTAMDRANAMFPTDAYHGTNADIHAFDPLLSDSRRKTGTPNGAIVTSTNPKTASTYAGEVTDDWGNVIRYGDNANVMPLRVNTGKGLSVNAKGANWNDLFTSKYPDAETTNDIAQIALEKGKNSATIKNVLDNATWSKQNGVDSRLGDSIFSFNPDDIRSRFAAFDPWRRNAAIAAAMGVAAPDLLAKDNNELASILKSRK
jgi:hypothetical protein